MRYALLAVGLFLLSALCIGAYQGTLVAAHEDFVAAALGEDARAAIEIRCRIEDARAANECRSTLSRLYLSGALDPDRTLRTWCDAVKTRPWGSARSVPPELCVRRYGGW